MEDFDIMLLDPSMIGSGWDLRSVLAALAFVAVIGWALWHDWKAGRLR